MMSHVAGRAGCVHGVREKNKKTRALREIECVGKASRPRNTDLLCGFHVRGEPWHRDSVEARIGLNTVVMLLQFQARSVILLLPKRPKRKTPTHTLDSHGTTREGRGPTLRFFHMPTKEGRLLTKPEQRPSRHRPRSSAATADRHNSSFPGETLGSPKALCCFAKLSSSTAAPGAQVREGMGCTNLHGLTG